MHAERKPEEPYHGDVVVTVKFPEEYVPATDPELGIVSFAPTVNTLGVLAPAFRVVKVPTVMLTPPAAMVGEPDTVPDHAQLPLLQLTLKVPGLPTFVLARMTPPVAVRKPLVPIVMVQLAHDGSTAKVPKSSICAVAVTVVVFCAPCTPSGASNSAASGPSKRRPGVKPGHRTDCPKFVFDITLCWISYS